MEKSSTKGTSIKVLKQSAKSKRIPLPKFIISLAQEARAFIRDCLKSRKWKFIYWKKKDKNGSEMRIEVNVNDQ